MTKDLILNRKQMKELERNIFNSLLNEKGAREFFRRTIPVIDRLETINEEKSILYNLHLRNFDQYFNSPYDRDLRSRMEIEKKDPPILSLTYDSLANTSEEKGYYPNVTKSLIETGVINESNVLYPENGINRIHYEGKAEENIDMLFLDDGGRVRIKLEVFRNHPDIPFYTEKDFRHLPFF